MSFVSHRTAKDVFRQNVLEQRACSAVSPYAVCFTAATCSLQS
jgi:hypothetical protein